MRVGIVGCGFQGQLHATSLAAIEGVEVVAACDLDGERLAVMERDHGVTGLHTGYRAMLAAERLDLVCVCVMASLHRDVTVAALEAGADVICEKPFAMDADEAAVMIETARRTGRRLTVGFNMRWFESARAIKGLVEDGTLGEPVCARGWMLADDVPWWGRHYVRGLSGGGALASTAVHMIDLILWLAGSPEPVTASASMARLFPRKRGVTAPSEAEAAVYDAEDLLFGHIRCANGFWLSIEGAWVWEGGGWNYSCHLVGDRAQARLEPLEVLGERDGAIGQDLLPPGTPAGTDFPRSVAAELAEWVAVLRSGDEHTVRLEQALAVQAVTDALYRSAALGREVAVDIPDLR